MEKSYSIAMIVGSLRKESYNRRAAHVAASVASANLKCSVVEIGELPLYNEDLDGTPPAEWTAFRNQIKAADGVIFFTPEYNRTIPGGLKNALDVASRPYGENVWNGKPAAVVSVTPGGLGAFGANHNLRQTLCFLNMPCMQQPEAYISAVHKLVEGDGFSESTTSFLQKFMQAYELWLSRNI